MISFSWRFPFVRKEALPVCNSIEEAIAFFSRLHPGETKTVKVAFHLTEEVANIILLNALRATNARGMNGGKISSTTIRISRR